MYINSNYQACLYGLNNPNAQLGDTPGSEDGDPALYNLLNEIYYADTKSGYGFQLSNPPTLAELQTLGNGIANLVAYFKTNGVPTSQNNPAAYQVYSAINTVVPGQSETLAQLFADLDGTDPTKASSAMTTLDSTWGVMALNQILSPAVDGYFHNNPLQNGYKDKNSGDTTIKAWIQRLQSYISTYMSDVSSGAPQNMIDQDATDIADALTNLEAALSGTSGGLQDGYLKTINDMIQASSGGSSSLLTYATNLKNGDAGALAAFESVLNTKGAAPTTVVQDLSQMLTFVMNGEY